MSEKNASERGALWDKTSARGQYMTGVIDGQPVVVFRNDRKTPGSKQPDWRVLKSEPKAAQSPHHVPVSRDPGDDDVMF